MKNIVDTRSGLLDDIDPSTLAIADSVVTISEVAVDTSEIVGDTVLSDSELRSLLKKPKNRLTKEEVLTINNSMKNKLLQIREMKGRLNNIKSSIISEISLSKDSQSSFRGVTVNDKLVRQAIKRSFGVKTNVITFDMYQAAVEALERLEIKESKDYSRGDWEE